MTIKVSEDWEIEKEPDTPVKQRVDFLASEGETITVV
jgi:hypothetical protein